MRPIRDRSSTITWQECCPTSKPKSSGAPIRPKDSSYCPGAGSLNAPSPGSTAVEDLPRTGRTSIARASHSCALPQSASCCENSVIPLDVLGQTLRGVMYCCSACLLCRHRNCCGSGSYSRHYHWDSLLGDRLCDSKARNGHRLSDNA